MTADMRHPWRDNGRKGFGDERRAAYLGLEIVKPTSPVRPEGGIPAPQIPEAPTSPPAPDGFVTSIQMCALTGASYRQCDFWCRTERLDHHYVRRTGKTFGAVADRAGSGTVRLHPESEVVVVLNVLRLLSAGFALERAFPLARALTTTGTVTLAPGLTLTTEGTP